MNFAQILSLIFLGWTVLGIVMLAICVYFKIKNSLILANLDAKYEIKKAQEDRLEGWQKTGVMSVRSSYHIMVRKARNDFNNRARFFLVFTALTAFGTFLVNRFGDLVNTWAGFY